MMTRLVLLFIVAGLGGASGQTLVEKNGTVVPAKGLVRNGELLMVPIITATGGAGQVGYQVADVAKLNLPMPAELEQARLLEAKGDDQGALARIEPVLAYQQTLRDIPGNWWAQAALRKAIALRGLNRVAEAAALLNEISNYVKDPETLLATKVQLALITKFDDPQKGFAAYDAIINQSTDPETLSQAWMAKAAIRVDEHEFEDALMDYLTVAVFYPEHNPLLPQALWGAGQAYDKIKDPANATKTYQTLISQFPDSPEAALAKAELSKKEQKT